nr:unnamed protein product [Callosobruchus chinensis]
MAAGKEKSAKTEERLLKSKSKTPIEDVSQTETQHSSIDGRNRIQESPKIEQNGSKEIVKNSTSAKAIKVMKWPYAILINLNQVAEAENGFEDFG